MVHSSCNCSTQCHPLLQLQERMGLASEAEGPSRTLPALSILQVCRDATIGNVQSEFVLQYERSFCQWHLSRPTISLPTLESVVLICTPAAKDVLPPFRGKIVHKQVIDSPTHLQEALQVNAPYSNNQNEIT